MKTILYTCFLMIMYISAYSQNASDILFQYTGQSTFIRKFGENNLMYYSQKNNKLITYKEETKMYPDSIYYLVKPKIVIFGAKMFETDSRPQINIRVDYYYHKAKQEPVKIDGFQQSYYPSIQKIVKMEDTRNKDGRVTFTMDDKSVWIVEIQQDGSNSLYYITQDEYPYLDYSLMFPNCKKEIENGIKL